MSAPLRLFQLSLKRVAPLLATTGSLLAAFQVLRVFIAASVHRAGQLDQIVALLPPFVRDIFGPSLGSVMTFNGLVCGVCFDSGVLACLLALTITLATLPAAEIEGGFADLILARPLARHWLVTRTIALLLCSTVLMLVMIVAGTWVGLSLFAPPEVPWPSARLAVALAVSLGLLLMCWGAVALALGAVCRRGLAGASTGLLALSGWLLDHAQRLWPPFGRVAWLSPFQYFHPFELIMGRPLPVGDLAVLGAITLAAFAAAYLVLSKRDISR